MKDTLEKAIQKALSELGISDVSFVLERPADMTHGDYASNAAMVAAKAAKQNPRALAEKIAEHIRGQNIPHVASVTVAGPGFINFTLDRPFFVETVGNILSTGGTYGASTYGAGKVVLVEYSSPNIAKPFTIGHLRSTIIGDALANILAFSGYTVVRDNHLGDWGTQFGKQIVALERWGGLAGLAAAKDKMRYLVDLYVRFHEEAEKDSTLEDLARKRFGDLERGEATALEVYKATIAYSMEYFEGIYRRLAVSEFDTAHGESFYGPFMPDVVSTLLAAGIARESEGALAVFFDAEKYPPFLVKKSDGSTLYATRDLATDRFRLDTYGPGTVILNEVGSEQILHFRQLFETERMLGWVHEGQRIHVAHGLYRFKDGKMSTRKGNVIWLEDILDEARQRALGKSEDVSENTGTDTVSDAEKKTVADAVSIGAIKFNDLRRESSQDIVFDWDEIMNLKGDSGPYVQYSCVRAGALSKKAHASGIRPSLEDALKDESSVLERLLERFPEVVARASMEYQPHHIATYLLELSGAFSAYYASRKIVDEQDPVSSYRILLVNAFAVVVKNGMQLLGIPVLERM